MRQADWWRWLQVIVHFHQKHCGRQKYCIFKHRHDFSCVKYLNLSRKILVWMGNMLSIARVKSMAYEYKSKLRNCVFGIGIAATSEQSTKIYAKFPPRRWCNKALMLVICVCASNNQFSKCNSHNLGVGPLHKIIETHKLLDFSVCDVKPKAKPWTKVSVAERNIKKKGSKYSVFFSRVRCCCWKIDEEIMLM